MDIMDTWKVKLKIHAVSVNYFLKIMLILSGTGDDRRERGVR